VARHCRVFACRDRRTMMAEPSGRGQRVREHGRGRSSANRLAFPVLLFTAGAYTVLGRVRCRSSRRVPGTWACRPLSRVVRRVPEPELSARRAIRFTYAVSAARAPSASRTPRPTRSRSPTRSGTPRTGQPGSRRRRPCAAGYRAALRTASQPTRAARRSRRPQGHGSRPRRRTGGLGPPGSTQGRARARRTILR
jgi:hypothetical protein